MIDVKFWDWTNTVGRLVRTLSEYKRFDEISFSVGNDGRFILRTRPKMTLDYSKSGIEGMTVQRINEGIYQVFYWGVITSHRYTEKKFDKEKDVHAFLGVQIELAKRADEPKPEPVTKEVPKKPLRRKKGKSVLCVETGETFISAREACRSVGLSEHYISRVCKSGKTAKGKHYKYLETNNDEKEV